MAKNINLMFCPLQLPNLFSALTVGSIWSHKMKESCLLSISATKRQPLLATRTDCQDDLKTQYQEILLNCLCVFNALIVSGTCYFTPEGNAGVVRSPTFIAEESFDVSAASVREDETSNYDCSESSCDKEEEEFSPERFLAAVAASNFKEANEGFKEIHESDVVCNPL